MPHRVACSYSSALHKKLDRIVFVCYKKALETAMKIVLKSNALLLQAGRAAARLSELIIRVENTCTASGQAIKSAA